MNLPGRGIPRPLEKGTEQMSRKPIISLRPLRNGFRLKKCFKALQKNEGDKKL